jgi:hypothetical protein
MSHILQMSYISRWGSSCNYLGKTSEHSFAWLFKISLKNSILNKSKICVRQIVFTLQLVSVVPPFILRHPTHFIMVLNIYVLISNKLLWSCSEPLLNPLAASKICTLHRVNVETILWRVESEHSRELAEHRYQLRCKAWTGSVYAWSSAGKYYAFY